MRTLSLGLVCLLAAAGCPDFSREAVPDNPPVVDAGDDQLVASGVEVLLQAIGEDADGDAFTFEWSQVAGLPVVLEADAETGVASFTAPDASTVIVLSVAGRETAYPDVVGEPDLLRIVVEHNLPPVADAGAFLETPNGVPVRLAGNAIDPDGDAIASWSWTLVSGPPGAQLDSLLTDTDTRTPLFSPTLRGGYRAELVVSDGLLESAADTLAIEVLNVAPEVSGGNDQLVAGGAAVVLQASGTDLDGDALTYDWSQVAGNTVTLIEDAGTGLASFDAPLASAVLVFSVIATDSEGARSAADPVIVTVDYNRAPVADAGTYLETPNLAPVRLTGRASDPDGDPIVSWSWTAVSGPVGVDFTTLLTESSTRTPLFSPTVRGGYELELVVSDGQISSAADLLRIEVLNLAPTVSAGPDQTVDGGQSVTLQAGATDLDGDALTYTWEQVAGPGVTLVPDASAGTATFTAPLADTVLVFSATATDSEGATSAEDLVAITVDYNAPPVAQTDGWVTTPNGTPLRLRGGGTDPEGQPIASWSWTVLTGPVGADLTGLLDDPASRTPLFTPVMKGRYDLELVVSDGEVSSLAVPLVVEALNNAPAAVPVATPGVADPSVVDLDASASTDPDGDALTGWEWSVISKPASGDVVFTPSATVENATATLSGRGVFFLGLKVQDAAGAWSPMEQLILQVNHRPVVVVPSNTVVALEGGPLGLDASGSFDVDGDPLVFTWARLEGSSLFPATLNGAVPPDPTPGFAALELSDADSWARYELVINDGDLDSLPVEVTVFVEPSDTNFVFVSDAAGAADGAGCGPKATPCRSLRGALAVVDPGATGAGDGRHLLMLSGAYNEFLTDSNIFWPTGVHLLAGRDPVTFARGVTSGLLIQRQQDLCSSSPAGEGVIQVPPTPGGGLLFSGLELVWANSCGINSLMRALQCAGCTLELRDARISYQMDPIAGASSYTCIPVRVDNSSDLTVTRSEIVSAQSCFNTNGIFLNGGLLTVQDSRVSVIGVSNVTGAARAIGVAGSGEAIVERSVLEVDGNTYAYSNFDNFAVITVGLSGNSGVLNLRNSVLSNTMGGRVSAVFVASNNVSIWNTTMLGDGITTGPGSGVRGSRAFVMGNSYVTGFPYGIYLATPEALPTQLHGNILNPAGAFLAHCNGTDTADLADLNAASGTLCNTSGQTWGSNTLAVCALTDPTGGDYSLNLSSPNACVDAGVASSPGGFPPSDDLDGEARPRGAGYDVGADEAL
ncbi:MAG: hypothetical protein P1V51_16180 [Deltaproteobacteria bacterium]|nr:hypothetical protein [Deltaproteobacteria bacterium]